MLVSGVLPYASIDTAVAKAFAPSAVATIEPVLSNCRLPVPDSSTPYASASVVPVAEAEIVPLFCSESDVWKPSACTPTATTSSPLAIAPMVPVLASAWVPSDSSEAPVAVATAP